MYFERWGLLVPPLGKVRFEGYVALASPRKYYTFNMIGVQR